jgi:hypothetical protein
MAMDREGEIRIVERDKYYIVAATRIKEDIEINIRY